MKMQAYQDKYCITHKKRIHILNKMKLRRHIMQDINNITGQTEFDRIWVLFQETREQIKETSAQLKETDRILSERFRETDAKFKETDIKIKETTEQIKETDRILSEKFKETRKMVGNLTNSWGEFVEGMVIPSVTQIFNERNIDIEEVHSRSKSRKGSETMEIDIIGDNDSYVVAIEVKSKLSSDNVIDFVEKLGRFKYFFPKYAGKKLVGAVAAITVDNSVRNLALKKKLFVIMQKGETVEIINEANFKPGIW